MPERSDQPMAGVVRVVYAIATALAAVLIVVMAITAFYDPPQTDFTIGNSGPLFGFDSAETGNYNRNVSMIFLSISAPVIIAGLALSARHNPLRAAMVLGGGALLSIGVGYAGRGSDQWLGFLLTAVNFVVLAGGFPLVEDGPLLAPRPARPPDPEPPSSTAGP